MPVATGYGPLLDNEPELARGMAASVRQEKKGSDLARAYLVFHYAIFSLPVPAMVLLVR